MAISINVSPWDKFVLCGADTAVTVEAADIENIPTGFRILVMDNAGTANTNNITVTCGTIAGSTSKTQTISANGGFVRLTSAGENGWIVG